MFPLPFSVRDIARYCEFLEENGEIERLDRFHWSLPTSMNEISSCESITISRIVVAFHKRNYQDLYTIIEGRNFSKKYHEKLQRFWYNARYLEAEKCRGRPLDAVAKYRVRRKFPAPRTICDEHEKSYCFKGNIRVILNKAYEEKAYPCLEDKRKLAEKTDLTVIQVSNWFKNKRQRIRMTQQRKRGIENPWSEIFNAAYNSCVPYHSNSLRKNCNQYPLWSNMNMSPPVTIRPGPLIYLNKSNTFTPSQRSINHGEHFQHSVQY